MDDDVFPDEHCLEKMISHISKDTKICIPSCTDVHYQDYAITEFNMSNPFLYKIESRKTKIYNDSIKGETINAVDMPFEGPLIENSLIAEIGLPKKRIFYNF